MLFAIFGVYLGLDMVQVRSNTSANSRRTVGCWAGGPGYSMSRMSWMGKLLRAPDRWSKPLDLEVAHLQNWEMTQSEAGPIRIEVKVFLVRVFPFFWYPISFPGDF